MSLHTLEDASAVAEQKLIEIVAAQPQHIHRNLLTQAFAKGPAEVGTPVARIKHPRPNMT